MNLRAADRKTERDAELERLRAGEWQTSSVLARLCAAAAEILQVPVALIVIRYSEKAAIAGSVGLELLPSIENAGFWVQAAEVEGVLKVTDIARSKFFPQREQAIALGVKSYLGLPLRTAASVAIGAFCAMDVRPRRFTARRIADIEALTAAAAIVVESERVRLDLNDEARARRQLELDLQKLHCDDALTGLPNLNGLVRAAAGELSPSGSATGLVLIDIDNFKLINDQWGFRAGDAYLKRIAQRLRAHVRSVDVVARVGGDEFALMIRDLPDPVSTMSGLAERIRADLKEIPGELGKANICTFSMGIAIAPQHGATMEELHQAAEFALCAVKSAGGDAFCVYDHELKRAALEAQALRDELKMNLGEGRFEPYYQPKIDLETGNVAGFEALARWRHRTRGVLAPCDFPLALKDKDLAPALTRAMVLRVAKDIAAWRAQGILPGPVSINISPPDLLNQEFPKEFLATLTDYRLPPNSIALEITEIVALGGRNGALFRSLAELRSAGISISLDDFGTGYAGLQHLRDWPIDQVKIDRSFVHGCLQNASDRAIVQAIVQLGDALSLGVTAEGIETPEQLELLQAMRCRQGQGFLFARPMACEDVPLFLGCAKAQGSATVH